MLKPPYLTGTTPPRVVELRVLDKGGLIGVRQPSISRHAGSRMNLEGASRRRPGEAVLA